MTEFRTIQQMLARRAEQDPARVAFRFLDDGGVEEATFTNGSLFRKAGSVASILRENGLRRQRIALVYQKAEPFICAFFGALSAGSTVVPLSLARMGFAESRMALTLRDAQIAAVLTDAVNYAKVSSLVRDSLGDGCKVLLVEKIDESLADETVDMVDPESTAVIQYTSGSTSAPKGVEISHANLLHNASMLVRASVSGLRDMVGLNWLPLFHDNGLMWGAVLPVYAEIPMINISPAAVIARPANWFRAISEHKVNVSGGPNFIYDLCVERIDPEKLSGVDLSRWEIAFCGAEPIRSDTIEQFRRRFAGLGLAPDSFLPCYGLAEATLMVSTSPRKTQPIVVDWDQDALETKNSARPWTEGRKRTLVSSGRIAEGHQVEIVDPELLHPCRDGCVGEIWVNGPSVAKGYWRRPDETKQTFGWALDDREGAGFMRTGDLGFLHGGELFVVGRIKDLIIIRGTNYYPQDVELTVEKSHPEFRKNAGAAFSIEIDGREELVVIQELKRGWKKADTSNCLESCKAAIAREHGLSVHSILLLAGGAIPKTSSGKVQRRLARAKFLEGAFAPVMQWSSRDTALGAGADTDDAGSPAARGAYVAPRGATEEVLARIWSEVLGLEQVGAADNFFELGGHSLLAMRMSARLNEAFGVELPLRTLFEAPVLSDLAERIAAVPVAQRAVAAVIAADPAGRFEKFPLTDVQQAYWIGRTSSFALSGAAHSYSEFEFERLDVDRFERALRRLIDRHDMLRMVVHPDGEQQVLERVPPYCLRRADLRGLAAAEVEAELARWRDRLSHQVLDSACWPLFEIGVCLLDGGRVRLFVSIDLLITDAGSRSVIVRDLVRFYADPEQADRPLTLSFRDCVLAQKAAEANETCRRDLAYWQGRLAHLPEGPPLPMIATSDAPRFRRWSGRLEAPSWERLKARGAQAGLTPSAILLTAFADVLAAFGGQLHFTINLTLFNRREHHPEIEEIVGDFTSVNLLEVSFGKLETFERRARGLQGQLWSDLDHSRVSGVRVMRELARIGRGRVLMPIVFTSTLGLGDGDVAFAEPMRLVDEISQTPQVALDHQVSESEAGLHFVWDVVAALFPAHFVPAMFESYCGWLRRLSEDEEAWQTVPGNLVPAAQLAGRREVNATAAPLSQMRLHELFLSQVARWRDQPAVIGASRQLSYGELERGSAGLAARLRGLGLRRGELVGVLMEKGWEQIVSVLAVLRAGAAYLPVDPALPPERVSHLLQHGGVRFVLTQPWLNDAPALPEGVQRLCVAGDLEAGAADWSEPAGAADELAYVIYTSGSTGVPKGVMIDHRGAVNTVLDINRRWAIDAGDRVLALSSLSFDLSVYDIFGPLAVGGAIVMPEASRRPDPAHWARMCAQHGVTVWNSVPALMELLLEHLQQGGETALPLRLVMLSGDWIAVTLPDRLRSVIEEATVVSLGGATEASIWSIGREVGAVDPGWVSIPYGRPLTNQTFHVLNEAGEECPEWVSGELYIGGIGVALGYWRDGGRTAERFVPSPYGDGSRLYRTGDLGRWLPGGEIEFLGRRDFQVKVQGHRIELGEIEAGLLRHAGVKEVVVITREDGPGDRRLVAYVTAAEGAALEAGELREHLKQRLPDYMVPSAFVVLDALPLTPNGKIDRKALPSAGSPAARGAYVAPRGATEEVLARIWSEVLGLEQVGAADNFFELGGHSLLAMRMSARLNEAFGVELPLRTLFEASSMTELAEQIQLSGWINTGKARAHAPYPEEEWVF